MPDLGKAYVQIVPSAEGITGSITKAISGESASAGEAAGLNIASGMKKVLVGGAIVAAAKLAFDGIKSMVSEFADYEQLTGGVETLFKDSADLVKGYAENAYKTAGLSANEYMETVTSFSASLLQSLGGDTAKAAKLADQAITDMSDNANKMGSSMESIQNAYQGFAKQNYTMLDNLKLGYGGNKTEMERLLKDAERLSGIHYDISSYADIVEAIHVVQTEMGITGTTAEEAAETISGSLNAAKAAWKNLLAGMGNKDADMDKLVNDFATAAEMAIDNITPVVETGLYALGELVDKLGPIISEKMPEFIAEVTPVLADALGQIFGNLVVQLPTLVGGLAEGIGNAIDSAIGIEQTEYYIDEYGQLMAVIPEATALTDGFGGSAGNAFESVASGASSAAEGEQQLVDGAKDVADALSEEEQAAAEAHAAIIDIAMAAVDARYSGGDLREEYNKLSGQMDKLRDSGDKTAVELAEQKLQMLNLAATNQELVKGLKDIPGAMDYAKDKTGALAVALDNAGLSADDYVDAVANMRDSVVNSFHVLIDESSITAEEMGEALSANKTTMLQWQQDLKDLWWQAYADQDTATMQYIMHLEGLGPSYAAAVHDFASGGYDELQSQAQDFADIGRTSTEMLADEMSANAYLAGDSGSEIANAGIDAMNGADWSTPGGDAISDWASGMTGSSNTAASAAQSVVSGARTAADAKASEFWYVGYNIDLGIVSGINDGSGLIEAAARAAALKAYRAAQAALDINSPSKLFRDDIGKAIPEGLALGIERNANLVTRAMRGLSDATVGEYRVRGLNMRNYEMARTQLAPDISGGNYSNVVNVTVNGAENPEDYATRLARQLKLQMNMRMV